MLGKRTNKPAQGYFFSAGGRIYKNETINSTIIQIAKNELNIKSKFNPKFIGVFEHFYDDSIYEDVSTHYVNLAYEIEIEKTSNLPTEQHSEYRWFTINELLESKQKRIFLEENSLNLVDGQGTTLVVEELLSI